MTMTSPSLIQTDSRKRVALAGVVQPGAYYLVTAEPSGRIILEPADVVSRLEQQVQANPQIMAEIAAFRANPSDVVTEPAR
jgi:hypothetical protein